MVFKSLSKDFVGFWAAYNLGNKKLMLTQLMKKLQSYELMLNDIQSIKKVETNLTVVSSSKGKGKHAKRNKTKPCGPLKMERKRAKKRKDLSKCFFCNKKRYFKANCEEWKNYLATKGKVFKETKDLRYKSFSLRIEDGTSVVLEKILIQK
ncbi:hypothetical protein PVK06_024324 [Gossypium arboreum]|uniref:Gag/pol protein n=1 Tax=Gossypium arboreum TaxID=29729 RepID=A0ABR0PDS2_GOSAR|nr:hypothetical protein PVK06_024324 [Gossypium arboreum]